MPSDKHNLIATRLWAWFLHCSTSFCPKVCLFANRNGSNPCIMVLRNIAFVLPCAPFLSPLLCRWQFVVHMLWYQCKIWESAVLVGALLTLFFAWNVTWSIQRVGSKTKHSNTLWSSDTPIFKSISSPFKPFFLRCQYWQPYWPHFHMSNNMANISLPPHRLAQGTLHCLDTHVNSIAFHVGYGNSWKWLDVPL